MPKTKTKTATDNLYAVMGSDESEVKRVAADLATSLTPPEAGDFGLEIVDGVAENADKAAARIRSTIEALQTLPFFGSTKVVWLKSANFLGDTQLSCATSVQFALEELLDLIENGLGSDVTFLISATEVDKRRSFYRLLVKRAELQIFDRLDSSRSGWEEEASEIVRSRAKKRKLQFDDEALDLFVLLTGGDTRQIENELEKIDIFLAGGRSTGFQPVGTTPKAFGAADSEPAGKMPTSPTASPRDKSVRLADKMAVPQKAPVPRVTVDLVRDLVPLSRAGVIFELSNALATRDLELALRLVRRLLDQGESAIGILLVAIVPTVRNLLLANDLMERHRLPRPHSPFQFTSAINRLPAEATDHLPRKKDGSINAYALGIAAQHAHQFETKQLIEAMQACLEANLQLVTTQLDHELILTEVVVKLLGPAPGRGD